MNILGTIVGTQTSKVAIRLEVKRKGVQMSTTIFNSGLHMVPHNGSKHDISFVGKPTFVALRNALKPTQHFDNLEAPEEVPIAQCRSRWGVTGLQMAT